MEAQILRRPAASCSLALLTTKSCLQMTLASSSPSTLTRTPQLESRRYKSSTSRTKRALNIAPHPSFLPTPNTTKSDHIIFNPPASEPSVFHTPLKFLPKNDPRRRAYLPALLGSSVTAPTSSDSSSAAVGPLPPVLNHPQNIPKRYTVKEEDVAEIRRLRALDPVKYSVPVLARKFNCTKLFIMMCTPAPREHQEMRRREKQAVMDRAGPRRAKAIQERARRLEMLFKGEL